MNDTCTFYNQFKCTQNETELKIIDFTQVDFANRLQR